MQRTYNINAQNYYKNNLIIYILYTAAIMNDTDSLLVFRLQRLRAQPKTVRGRCILFYASLNERPCARITLALAFILFFMAHCLAFCSMIYACFEVSVCFCTKSRTIFAVYRIINAEMISLCRQFFGRSCCFRFIHWF